MKIVNMKTKKQIKLLIQNMKHHKKANLRIIVIKEEKEIHPYGVSKLLNDCVELEQQEYGIESRRFLMKEVCGFYV